MSDSFAGIGRGGGGIDLLSHPARDMVWETPLPTVTFLPSGRVPYCGPTPRHQWIAPQVPWTSGQVHPDAFVTNGTQVAISSGSGLSVRGHYSSSKWNVSFSLGGGTPVQVVDRWCGQHMVPPVCTYPLFGWVYPSGSYWAPVPAIGPNSYGQDPRLYQQAPAQKSLQPSMNQVPNQAPVSLSPLELARVAMYEEEPKVAIEALRREIKQQGEKPETLRLLSLALAMDRRWDDAAAVMRAAYRLDPKLGDTPMDLFGLGFSAADWRSLVTRAVTNANRGKSASEWLLVGAFMQAEGRGELAAKMVDKAAAAGLEAEIAAGFPRNPKNVP